MAELKLESSACRFFAISRILKKMLQERTLLHGRGSNGRDPSHRTIDSQNENLLWFLLEDFTAAFV